SPARGSIAANFNDELPLLTTSITDSCIICPRPSSADEFEIASNRCRSLDRAGAFRIEVEPSPPEKQDHARPIGGVRGTRARIGSPEHRSCISFLSIAGAPVVVAPY